MTERHRYLIQARGWPRSDVPPDDWQDCATAASYDAAMPLFKAFKECPGITALRILNREENNSVSQYWKRRE
jgi:hypothetical protein